MNFNTARVTNTIVALVSAIILSFSSISFGFAQDNEAYIRRIASMEADKTGPLNPVGLTFSFESENFYLVEDQSRRPSLAVNSEVIAISALSNRKDSGRIAGIIEDPLAAPGGCLATV